MRGRVHRFLRADLDEGIPDEAGDGYDVVLLADALTRARRPEVLLAAGPRRARARRHRRRLRARTSGTGTRGAAWSLGAFDYDRRGILDQRQRALLHPAQLRAPRWRRRASRSSAARRSACRSRCSGAASRRAGAAVGRRGTFSSAWAVWASRSDPRCSRTSSSTSSAPPTGARSLTAASTT